MIHKCHHLSITLSCAAGGEGHIACLDPKYHNACPFKHAAEHKEAEHQGKKLTEVLKLKSN